MQAIPVGAAICTECESWQFTRRFVSLFAKFAFVLLVPLAAWVIAYIYQRNEQVTASTQAAITRTADQTAEVLNLNKDFQVSSDTLLTNCSKEGQTASNLCLAEYVDRIIQLNGLTSQFSWKSGTLPLPKEAVTAQRRWTKSWWEIAGTLKKALVAMAKSGRLLKCQELDFTESECGGELRGILDPFRQETTVVMCAASLALRRHTLALYASLPSSDETTALVNNVRVRLDDSSCAKLVDKRPTPP